MYMCICIKLYSHTYAHAACTFCILVLWFVELPTFDVSATSPLNTAEYASILTGTSSISLNHRGFEAPNCGKKYGALNSQPCWLIRTIKHEDFYGFWMILVPNSLSAIPKGSASDARCRSPLERCACLAQ